MLISLNLKFQNLVAQSKRCEMNKKTSRLYDICLTPCEINNDIITHITFLQKCLVRCRAHQLKVLKVPESNGSNKSVQYTSSRP